MAVTHHITATSENGQTHTVNLERNFVLDTGRGTLVCNSCGWRDSPLSVRKTYMEFAGEHLAQAHGANLDLAYSASASFRRLQLVAPLLAVGVVLLGMMFLR
ncbi:hypothetical protein GCM10010389_60970 [Streptomyces echinoruber]|jgi:hypothetical protein|uniref:Uncharacterized protein n=1 Tax=Streptomyces echinoruber TaxID=68898 RepID=A0A918RYU6_9ACTN|nr:hypothetical protein GCM10010389_60970 [Streptomyces echinoruber]